MEVGLTDQLVPQDEAILAIVVDLCRKIKLSRRYDPQKIGWSQNVSWDFCRFSPGVRKRTELLLPLGLRTKLEPDQWRPLLAYSLLQKKNSRLMVYSLFIFITPIIALALATAYVGFMFGTDVGRLFGSVLTIPALLLGMIMAFHYDKKRLLRYVGEAADLGGKSVMLAALEKISSLGIWEVEKAKKRQGLIGRLWPIPSIDERIKYLNAYTN
jgi:hypothetical protein